MKKLNEILEECIEAGLTGRRSLEASLTLYPAQAAELEPLLRTALSISDSFQSYTPPAAAEQRIRTRFLADAAARQNLRHLEGSFEKSGWFSGLFRRPAFRGFAAAAVVAIAVVAITIGVVDRGGNDEGGSTQFANVSPTTVSDLGERVSSITRQIESGGQVQSADLAAISALFDQLTSASPEELQESSAELEAILPDMIIILNSASNSSLGATSDQAVIEAIDIATRDLASVLGLVLPDPAAVGVATPVPTDPPVEPTDVPVEPTDAPVASTPAPTDGGATVAPTATPPPASPTSTPDDRSPPGFLP